MKTARARDPDRFAMANDAYSTLDEMETARTIGPEGFAMAIDAYFCCNENCTHEMFRKIEADWRTRRVSQKKEKGKHGQSQVAQAKTVTTRTRLATDWHEQSLSQQLQMMIARWHKLRSAKKSLDCQGRLAPGKAAAASAYGQNKHCDRRAPQPSHVSEPSHGAKQGCCSQHNRSRIPGACENCEGN